MSTRGVKRTINLDDEDDSSTNSSKKSTDSKTEESAENSEVYRNLEEVEIAQFLNNLEEDNAGGTAGEFMICGSLSQPNLQAPITGIRLLDDAFLKFPLVETELEQLIPKFNQSLFGRGEVTVLDTNVRNSWELNPQQFEIQNPAWNCFINYKLIPTIQKQLGIQQPICGNLYKLLLYKTGSFFKVHRDTEKEPRMFGTLVVQLPSTYTGGALRVCHDGTTKTCDFSTEKCDTNQYQTFYSAFYCDCEHEVLPITSGIRVSLIYNLVLMGCATVSCPLVAPPNSTCKSTEFKILVENWRQTKPEGVRDTLQHVHLFAHQYSKSNLGWDNLKGTDHNVVSFLRSVAADLKLTLMLGFLETEKHISEHDVYEAENEFDDRNPYTLKSLILLPSFLDHDSRANESGEIKCNLNQISPTRRIRELKPYSEQALEFTGNDGATITKQYRRAGIVIFPNEIVLKVLNGGWGGNLAAKLFVMKHSEFERDTNNSEIKEELYSWIEFMLHEPFDTSTEEIVVENLLQVFLALNDSALISRFIVAYKIHLIRTINTVLPWLMPLATKFGLKYFVQEIQDTILLSMAEMQKEHVKCLEVFLVLIETYYKTEDDTKQVFQNTLGQILAKFKNVHDREGSMHRTPWGGHQISTTSSNRLKTKATVLCRLYKAVKAIEFTNVLEYVSTLPFYIVVPALISYAAETQGVLDKVTLIPVAEHFVQLLKAEVEKPIAGPSWHVRNDFIPCSSTCSECRDLSVFMTSSEVTHGFKMSKSRRLHLQRELDHFPLLSFVTEKIGDRPHTLVVTKLPSSKKRERKRELEIQEQSYAKTLLEQLEKIIKSTNEAATTSAGLM